LARFSPGDSLHRHSLHRLDTLDCGFKDGRDGEVSRTIVDGRFSRVTTTGTPGFRRSEVAGEVYNKNRPQGLRSFGGRTGKRGLLGGKLAGHGGAGSDGEVGGGDGGHFTRWVALSCVEGCRNDGRDGLVRSFISNPHHGLSQ